MPGDGNGRRPARARLEWPTLALIGAVHGSWIVVLAGAGWLGPLPSLLLLIPVLVLHSSLQHEVIHGHPTGRRWLDEALVSLPVGLVIPFERFRDQHLAHHHDPNLTDPYDDPETNYLDPVVWVRMPPALRLLRRANNTLLGRMVIGPPLSLSLFWRDEWHARHDPAVRRAWRRHGLGAAAVLAAVWLSGLPFWAYALAVYGCASVLRIRTFLEHRADHRPRARSAVVEDRGPLAFLFLNNNLHALHHAHPGVPWYALPRLYGARRAAVLARNDGYRYASYGEVFRRYLFRQKDWVDHPLWHSGNRTTAREDVAALLPDGPDLPQCLAPAHVAGRH